MGFHNYILESLELGDRISLLLWEMSRRVCFTYTLPIWKSSRSAVLMIYYNPKFKLTAQNFRLFKKNCEVGLSWHSRLQGKSRNFTEAFASSWLNYNIHSRQRKGSENLSMDVTLNGLFQKKSTPPWWKAQFFDPPFHLDFQNCLSPPPLRISKFKDLPNHLDFHKIVKHHNFNLHSM